MKSRYVKCDACGMKKHTTSSDDPYVCTECLKEELQRTTDPVEMVDLNAAIEALKWVLY